MRANYELDMIISYHDTKEVIAESLIEARQKAIESYEDTDIPCDADIVCNEILSVAEYGEGEDEGTGRINNGSGECEDRIPGKETASVGDSIRERFEAFKAKFDPTEYIRATDKALTVIEKMHSLHMELVADVINACSYDTRDDDLVHLQAEIIDEMDMLFPYYGLKSDLSAYVEHMECRR